MQQLHSEPPLNSYIDYEVISNRLNDHSIEQGINAAVEAASSALVELGTMCFGLFSNKNEYTGDLITTGLKNTSILNKKAKVCCGPISNRVRIIRFPNPFISYDGVLQTMNFDRHTALLHDVGAKPPIYIGINNFRKMALTLNTKTRILLSKVGYVNITMAHLSELLHEILGNFNLNLLEIVGVIGLMGCSTASLINHDYPDQRYQFEDIIMILLRTLFYNIVFVNYNDIYNMHTINMQEIANSPDHDNYSYDEAYCLSESTGLYLLEPIFAGISYRSKMDYTQSFHGENVALSSIEEGMSELFYSFI